MSQRLGVNEFLCDHCGAIRHRGVTPHQYPGEDRYFRINPSCANCHAPRFELEEGMSPNEPGRQPRYGEDDRIQSNGRDIFRREGATGRPSYTLDDPPGTVRTEDYKEGFDRVIFPITRNNVISRMTEEELQNTEGSLWPLQQAIFDARFALLKKVVAGGDHMVGPIVASVVITMECRCLTDKAKSVVKVPEHVETIDMLMPNGDLRTFQP